MFVISVKTGKRRIVLTLAAALAALTAVLAGGKLLGADGADSLPAGETNGERLAFLAGYGWEAEEEPVEMREVLIPAEFDDVYLRYNEVQRAQGMDLAPYAGKTCSQWIYRVTNYPSEEEVRAALLVLDGKIIGGDLSSTALGGFLCGFGGEGLETPWSLPQESAAASEPPAGEAAESAPPESESPASGDAAAEAAGTEIIPDDAWPID